MEQVTPNFCFKFDRIHYINLFKIEDAEPSKYLSSLPASIKVVTKPLESNEWTDTDSLNWSSSDKVMIRLYNMNEHFDGFNSTIKVDLFGILADLIEMRESFSPDVSMRITEWNLSLNKMIKDMPVLRWKFINSRAVYDGVKDIDESSNIINLGNQEMRTFVVEFEKKSNAKYQTS